MGYDDLIEFDDVTTGYDLREAKTTITKFSNIANELKRKLEDLQQYAHDKKGTAIDEDYLDFKEIFSDSCICGFVDNLDNTFDTLTEELTNIKKTTEV